MEKLMSDDIKRTFTEEQCVEHGGHFWKYWSGKDQIDQKTYEKTGVTYAVCFPKGTPNYRGCPLCGKKEIERHYWESA